MPEHAKRARVLDCDGVVIQKLNKTLLEQFLIDYYKKTSGIKKIDLGLRAFLIRFINASMQGVIKVFFSSDYYITGETNLLRICDLFFIRKAKIPATSIKQFASNYANVIKPSTREAINACEDDIYIVTAEPKQLVWAVLETNNVSKKIKEVYGTAFEIKENKIVGFEKFQLYAGVRGKMLGLEKILSKNYDEVYAIGDSVADVGLFSSFSSNNIIPFTFYDSPKQVQDFVKEKGGQIVNSLEDFFKYS
ncbi:MAG: HAD family hydrolase [Candidatus Nanoarchaeia archaeon]